tara:strand:- start:122 stop:337 length:216 start_codon:yes stop_codon:yes gene_type:complete
VITTTILITLLGVGFFWAYRIGVKMNRLNQMQKGQEVVRSVSENAREIDEQTKKDIASSGPVSAPWLRKRH